MLTRIFVDEYVNYYYPADFLSKIIFCLLSGGSRGGSIEPLLPAPVFFSLPQLKALGEHV